MAERSVYKQCSCRNENGVRLGARCPKLRRTSGSWHPTHGWWSYQIELPRSASGKRRPLRRGHFAGSEEAAAERGRVQELLALAGDDPKVATQIGDLLAAVRANQPLPELATIARRVRAGVPASTSRTVADYLTEWHAGRRNLAAGTHDVYGGHIRNYLIPHLGTIPLDGLRLAHIGAMFDWILDRNTQIEIARSSEDPAVRATVTAARVVSAATMHRIRATLRKALNDAIRRHRYLEYNPAIHVELPSGKRPKAKVWTKAAVRAWRATGARPSAVMVWTPAQAGAFLDYAEAHDIVMYPIYALILHRGLRRGEAVGLRDADVDLDAKMATIAQQITDRRVQASHQGRQVRRPGSASSPWTRSPSRSCAPTAPAATSGTCFGARSANTVRAVLHDPRRHPRHPEQVTNRFEILVRDAGLPPIRLHDLRHCAATYLKASGADIKDIQETLGHASSTITSDTYTSVILELESEIAKADAAVNLIPRTDRKAS